MNDNINYQDNNSMSLKAKNRHLLKQEVRLELYTRVALEVKAQRT
jgi:hypothetical protein